MDKGLKDKAPSLNSQRTMESYSQGFPGLFQTVPPGGPSGYDCSDRFGAKQSMKGNYLFHSGVKTE